MASSDLSQKLKRKKQTLELTEVGNTAEFIVMSFLNQKEEINGWQRASVVVGCHYK